jgi:hypothetical protein
MDLLIAIALAAGFSLLIGAIELVYRSKAKFIACLNGSSCLYVLVLLIGNIATTLFAAATLGGIVPETPANAGASEAKDESGKLKEGSGLTTPSDPAGQRAAVRSLLERFPWFWYAFLGVFGFEVLLQNMNLTFFGKGMLSINDWISKARDNAVALAVENQAQAVNRESQSLAARLRQKPPADLNAQVVNCLGAARLTELVNTAKATGADESLVKALALANEAPDKARAIP